MTAPAIGSAWTRSSGWGFDGERLFSPSSGRPPARPALLAVLEQCRVGFYGSETMVPRRRSTDTKRKSAMKVLCRCVPIVGLPLSIVAVFAAAGVEAAELSASEPTLSVLLEVANTSFNAQEPLSVQFTLSNDSREPLQVLAWTTPLNGVSNNIFTVVRGREQISYIGPLVKRGAPTAGDLIGLAPGESRT